MHNMTRRSLLTQGAGIGGGLAIASFAQAFKVSAAEGGDDAQTILNLAATAETLAVTFYAAIINKRAFELTSEDDEYLRFALDAEQYHLDFLKANGGVSLANKFYVPGNLLVDRSVFVKTAADAETAFVGAYLAATRRFADLGFGRLAATTAQHACSEAQHLAIARDIGGFLPNNLALPLPVYFNVSDAVPTLAPFLQGGDGYVGPVDYPTADEINAIRGKSDPTVPFVYTYNT